MTDNTKTLLELTECDTPDLMRLTLEAAFSGDMKLVFTILRAFEIRLAQDALSEVPARVVFENLQWFAVDLLSGTLEMEGHWDGESEITVEPAPGVEITLQPGHKAVLH